jgi:hypothetical protein
VTIIAREINNHMEDIAIFYKELAILTGLPLWALVVLLVFLFIFVYLYGILIPISIRRIRKDLINLNKKFVTSSWEEDNNKKNKTKPRYKWKS